MDCKQCRQPDTRGKLAVAWCLLASGADGHPCWRMWPPKTALTGICKLAIDWVSGEAPAANGL